MLDITLPKKTSLKIYQQTKKSRKKLLHLFACYPVKFQEKKNLWIGLLDLLDGLEYHHGKIACIERSIQKKYSLVRNAELLGADSNEFLQLYSRQFPNGLVPYCCAHELTAYLNRMGQIYYFFTSSWIHNLLCQLGCCDYSKIKKRIKQVCIVNNIIQKAATFLAIMPFRHKYSAHRVSDKSLGIDSEEDKNLSGYGFNIAGLRPAFSYSLNDKNDKGRIYISLNVCKKSRDIFLNQAYPNGLEDVEFICEKSERVLIQFKPTICHQKLVQELLILVKEFLTNHSEPI